VRGCVRSSSFAKRQVAFTIEAPRRALTFSRSRSASRQLEERRTGRKTPQAPPDPARSPAPIAARKSACAQTKPDRPDRAEEEITSKDCSSIWVARGRRSGHRRHGRDHQKVPEVGSERQEPAKLSRRRITGRQHRRFGSTGLAMTCSDIEDHLDASHLEGRRAQSPMTAAPTGEWVIRGSYRTGDDAVDGSHGIG